MTNIKTCLKDYRLAKKLSQQELAQLIGVRRETIVHLEANRYNPSLEMALKLAQVFEVQVEELFSLKSKLD
ncbi:helix-turn-helix transcriptional regulator [Streptococcus caprae]|uniref:Helix-turn-helix transcriptional regulator n=1 Tax=Streptococcus caprae TaxID=1640501 RepID=A0ABV8CWJ7_9STRE